MGTQPCRAVFPEWINESFSRSANLQERWKKFTPESANAHAIRPYAFRALHSTSWAPLFESYDAGSTRLPLEMRHPMVDVRLVEYVLGIPPVPWCVNKEILRIAMTGKLPTAVLNREKTPLAGVPSLYQVQDTKVRFVDDFEPAPSLARFVNLTARPRLAGERNSERLWVNLRPFGLNYWLLHSLSVD